MKAILLVGHGSRDWEGNEQVRQFIKQLTPHLDDSFIIETCFLEFEKPTVSQGIDLCVQRGASEIHLIPMMLLQAGHSKIHIPAEIDHGKEKYPNVRFVYGRPIGIHEEVLQICLDRLIESGENVHTPHQDTAVIVLGRGGSDPDANSDLYKVTRLLWEKMNYEVVEPAFMGVTKPLLKDVVDRCIKLGAKKVVILPYFLFTGILIKRLEKMLDQFQLEYSTVQFKLANYFGFHDKLKTVIQDRIDEALQDNVKMNCDTCQYRYEAMDHIGHHHHHDHEHGDHNHAHGHNHQSHGHDAHEQHHEHGHQHDHRHDHDHCHHDHDQHRHEHNCCHHDHDRNRHEHNCCQHDHDQHRHEHNCSHHDHKQTQHECNSHSNEEVKK